MNAYEELPCAHLYVVGDTECRLCLRGLEGTALTDQTDDQGVDWGEQDAPTPAAESPQWEAGRPPIIYPEYPPLAEAPISINFKVTGEPMITVRGHDAAQITALLNDMNNGGVWANIAAAQVDLRTQGGLGAGLGPVGPVTAPTPPPGAVPQAAPPPFGPNVSVPNAPGYQGPPSYQSAPPQSGNWGGGGGGGNFQGQGPAQPKPQPPGWMRVNARSGPGFDTWKNLREVHKDYLKGKISWGGKSDFWIEPSIAQWLAQQGFAVTP